MTKLPALVPGLAGDEQAAGLRLEDRDRDGVACSDADVRQPGRPGIGTEQHRPFHLALDVARDRRRDLHQRVANVGRIRELDLCAGAHFIAGRAVLGNDAAASSQQEGRKEARCGQKALDQSEVLFRLSGSGFPVTTIKIRAP